MGLVPGTGPTNSNNFEFVGLVVGTKFWSLRLHFLTKMGSAHEGNWYPGLVARTSPVVCADLIIDVCCFRVFNVKILQKLRLERYTGRLKKTIAVISVDNG